MKLLDRAKKRADNAEVYEIRGRSIPVKFSSGELESIKHVETAGAALRVIDDDKLGFSTTTDLEETSSAVDRAVETAGFGDQAGFEFPDSSSSKGVDTYDSRLTELSASELIDYGEEAVDRLREFDPDLEVDLDLSRSVTRIRIANSNGLEVEEERTNLSLSLQIKKVEEDDIFSLYESCSARTLDQFDLSVPLEKIIQKVKWAEREGRIGSGTYPVIFTPRGTLVLLIPLLSGFNGKNVYQGTSPLAGELGEGFFSDRLDLSDFGSMEGSPSRRSFDDEGTPVNKVKLIENGEVRNFLYDLQTAGQSGAEPTGNGLKGGLIGGSDFRSPPGISPTTLVIGRGRKKFGKMISDIDRGLVVDQVLGLGQGNLLSGEFSNNVSVAYKIEDGAIVGKVKDTMIAGNVYQLLEDGIELGKETEWVGGQLAAPPIVMDLVNVVQKG